MDVIKKSNCYKVTVNDKRDRIKIDFRRKSHLSICSRSDIEIGITDNNKLSYLSINLRDDLDEDLKSVIRNLSKI